MKKTEKPVIGVPLKEDLKRLRDEARTLAREHEVKSNLREKIIDTLDAHANETACASVLQLETFESMVHNLVEKGVSEADLNLDVEDVPAVIDQYIFGESELKDIIVIMNGYCLECINCLNDKCKMRDEDSDVEEVKKRAEAA